MSEWKSKSIKRQPGRQKISKVGKKNGKHTARLLGAAVILIAIFYLLSFVMPRVDIIIIPKSRPVVFDDVIKLVIRDDLETPGDLESETLSGKKVFVSGEANQIFETTGKKDIGDKASGRAIFFNYTGLSQEVLIEDGLETNDGKLFTVLAPLIIPPASVSPEGDIVPGQISADIIALEPGEDSNIDPQKIFIHSVPPDKQLKIYGEVNEKLTGGTSEIVNIISDEDITQAQEALSEALRNQLLLQISEDLPSDKTFMQETFVLSDEEFVSETEAGEETDEFSLELKARGEVVIYKNEQLTELIKKSLSERLTPEETFLTKEPQSLEITEVKTEPSGDVLLTIKAAWPVSQPIDLEPLKDEVLGAREADARRILLNQDGISDVRFDWAFAINKRIPRISSHVNLELKLNN